MNAVISLFMSGISLLFPFSVVAVDSYTDFTSSDCFSVETFDADWNGNSNSFNSSLTGNVGFFMVAASKDSEYEAQSFDVNPPYINVSNVSEDYIFSGDNLDYSLNEIQSSEFGVMVAFYDESFTFTDWYMCNGFGVDVDSFSSLSAVVNTVVDNDSVVLNSIRLRVND